MSELTDGKELKGLGGWLVLFQIQIFSSLAGAAQMLIFFPIAAIITENFVSLSYYHIIGSNVYDIFEIYRSPVTYVFAASVFVLTLLCVIFFYKKKLVFRLFFIAESVIYIIAMCFMIIYLVNSLGGAYEGLTGGEFAYSGVFTVFYTAFGLLPLVGITVAFIIALFKSRRVKNTFS